MLKLLEKLSTAIAMWADRHPLLFLMGIAIIGSCELAD